MARLLQEVEYPTESVGYVEYLISQGRLGR